MPTVVDCLMYSPFLLFDVLCTFLFVSVFFLSASLFSVLYSMNYLKKSYQLKLSCTPTSIQSYTAEQ